MSAKPTKRGRGRTRSQVPTVRALERGLMVLEVLSRGGDVSLSDIARATDLTCSTSFRILETLSQRGYALQDGQSGRYRLGVGAIQIGLAYSANSPLPAAADPAMRELVRTTKETANLAILDGDQAVYIHQVESKQSVRMFTQLGARAPVYCTGVGKVLVAWRSAEEVAQMLSNVSFEAFTSNTIPNLEKLQIDLERVKNQGYAIDDEERELGVRCVTAPVRRAREMVVAALSVSAPASRLPKGSIIQRSRKVIAAANEISARLGFVSRCN